MPPPTEPPDPPDGEPAKMPAEHTSKPPEKNVSLRPKRKRPYESSIPARPGDPPFKDSLTTTTKRLKLLSLHDPFRVTAPPEPVTQFDAEKQAPPAADGWNLTFTPPPPYGGLQPSPRGEMIRRDRSWDRGGVWGRREPTRPERYGRSDSGYWMRRGLMGTVVDPDGRGITTYWREPSGVRESWRPIYKGPSVRGGWRPIYREPRARERSGDRWGDGGHWESDVYHLNY
ncbi:hypothetical protein FN846DRAFT_904201 [Sphaerosporella brunnea]|uniref:Uncharacterized protein n=1 Tax=Sphaerosporella brunnea TaxID=1250544 RepID=A0A5J5F504_9PEZI|nr:hypothetical protein FN846DRAFT_904201 [Sphaerosporella brunnea]